MSIKTIEQVTRLRLALGNIIKELDYAKYAAEETVKDKELSDKIKVAVTATHVARDHITNKLDKSKG